VQEDVDCVVETAIWNVNVARQGCVESLLERDNMARWTFERWIGEIDLQVLGKVAPPVAQFGAFRDGALVRAGW
jgi:hypothetical protein